MRTERKKTGKVRATMTAGSLATLAALMCTAQLPLFGMGQSGLPTGTPSGTHQTGGTAPASIGGSSPLGGPGSLDAASSPFPDLSRQKRNDERQRRLVIDTQRLLVLTGQLKTEVATTGAETMSPEMLKQMEEIEKLAKSVKDKMRD